MTQMESSNEAYLMYQTYLNVIIPIVQYIGGFITAIVLFFVGKDIYFLIKGEN